MAGYSEEIRPSRARVRSVSTFPEQASIVKCPDAGSGTYYNVESIDDESLVTADHPLASYASIMNP